MTVQNSPELDLNAERIESLKAGMIAALALFAAFVATTGLNQFFLARQFQPLASLLIIDINFSLVISVAVVIVSGFVFGITYRYVIRDDKNSHLQEGAVLAFGLVRGLAQLDTGLLFKTDFWPLVVLGGESLLLFAVGRLVLDIALHWGWVKFYRG
ncbi:hypothetical protein NG798_04485 [Ancylothrix sp. C2]|uniref:hypothetical protein n=1 Tax=Ancylothrix sp. D3o TaxID=2953691 RepID=UPI0021BA83F7|nr:hypothetical protein [Ancylothrix sp. D3o]MCT7949036.1 hypothetical protein [Ancylothrix sp. D3o]